jgi:hypothetical protein
MELTPNTNIKSTNGAQAVNICTTAAPPNGRCPVITTVAV